MFERMTEPARRVVAESRHVARHCGHGSIEAPHLLLGILRATHTHGYRALHHAGLRYDEVLPTVQSMYDQPARATQLSYGADSQSLFEILLREAPNAEPIETAHLALACTHVGELPSLARFVAGRESAIRELALSGLRSRRDQDANTERAGEELLADGSGDRRKRRNEVRVQRARLKRALKARRVSLHMLLFEPPPCIQRATVAEFLAWLPGYGRVRGIRLLVDSAICPTKALDLLTTRERRALLERLDPPTAAA